MTLSKKRRRSRRSRRFCDCSPPKPLGIKCKNAKGSEVKELRKLMTMLNKEDPADGESASSRSESKGRTARKSGRKGRRKIKSRSRKRSTRNLTPSFEDRMATVQKNPHCPDDPIECAVQTAMRIKARKLYRGVNRPHVERETVTPPEYEAPEVCKIILPGPILKIKHANSDESIIHVASPCASFCSKSDKEQTANEELPSKKEFALVLFSRLQLRKPRSGLFINVAEDFVPEPDIISLPPMEKECEVLKRGKRKAKHPSESPVDEYGNDEASESGDSENRGRDYRGEHGDEYGDEHGDKSEDYEDYDEDGHDGGGRSKHGGAHRSLVRSVGGRSISPRKKHSLKSVQKYLAEDPCSEGDMIPEPEYVSRDIHIRKGTFGTHSLTMMSCPEGRDCIGEFGLVHGSFNMFNAKFGSKSRGKQALTMCIMSYCMAFHYHPKQWNMKIIDTILDVGDLWFQDLLERMHDHSAVLGLCEVLPFGKKEYLVLNGMRMQVLLFEPEIVGYTRSTDPTVFSLCKALKVFFKDRRAGIFLSRNLKVAIWKDKVCYFVFDPCGRDLRAYSNFSSGRAGLICVQTLQAVAELILIRSPVEDLKFILSEIKILKMMLESAHFEDDEVDEYLTPTERAMLEYKIINENYAILNATFHLGDKCFEGTKFKQALPIAVAAMTYAKISPPNTWIRKTVDKILKIGNKVYLDCACPDPLVDVTIDDIPNEIKIGPYNCEIIIYRDRVKGQLFTKKDCLMNIQMGLEEFFDKKGYNSGILQFNIYTLGIWRQNGMYYTFDPYPRSPEGLIAIKGKGCNVMQLNTTVMAEMLERNWNYLPAQTQYVIHAFKVLRLSKTDGMNMHLLCSPSKEGLEEVVDVSPRPGGDYKMTKVPRMPPKPKSVQLEDVKAPLDEEHMEDIVSLVDSIRDDYVPKMPMKCEGPEPEEELGVVELDSPTLSATQVIQNWPEPRDKKDEEPEPDPDPEPEPPPPPVMPEGGWPEEEEGEEKAEEEEEEEEDTKKKKKRKKGEAETPTEELPPPPPSPQPEPEPEPAKDELIIERVEVERKILLPSDAAQRRKKRAVKKRMDEKPVPFVLVTPSAELAKPSSFMNTPDGTQIIVGTENINYCTCEVTPFVSIMAIVISHKYLINTWNKTIVNFVTSSGQKLFSKRKDRFQSSPAHLFPRMVIGQNVWNVAVIAADEGEIQDLLKALRAWMAKRARAVLATPHHSWGIMRHNGIVYLFDGGPVSGVGVAVAPPARAALMRFTSLDTLVDRIICNNGSDRDHYVLSRVIVVPTEKLPRKQYTFPKEKSPPGSRTSLQEKRMNTSDGEGVCDIGPPGFRNVGGRQIIPGTIGLPTTAPDNHQVKECHFIGAVAILMLALRPIETWDSLVMDTVFEKGMQIYDSACNLSVSEARTIKNISLEDMLFNLNIKKIETCFVFDPKHPVHIVHHLSQIFCWRRFIMIRYPSCSLVVHFHDGYLYLFDPYADETNPTATWTQYCCLPDLVHRIMTIIPEGEIDFPEFYSYELTSAKKQSQKAAFHYRMSPLFQSEEITHADPLQPIHERQPRLEEKISWLRVKHVPWTRTLPHNAVGCERKVTESMARAWDIEIPHDLYSVWGSLHPLSMKLKPENRGKQILAMNVVAIAMTYAYDIAEWNSSIVDAIVKNGDTYYEESVRNIDEVNHELMLCDLNRKFCMYPYKISAHFERSTFGIIYSIHPVVMNLSTALDDFFEKSQFGIIISTAKNLAFGRIGCQYFMFDCQSCGMPVFPPHVGTAYVLRCESFNRFLYCMTLTLNAKRHNVPFDIYSVNLTMYDFS